MSREEEITIEALTRLGFTNKEEGVLERRNTSYTRHVLVYFDDEKKFDCVFLEDYSDDFIVPRGVKNLADLRDLYRLVTGETLPEVK